MRVSKAEFARMQGVSRSRVGQWVRTQIISANPDGSIDPEKARRELAKNRDEFRRLDYEARVKSSEPSNLGQPEAEYLVKKQFIEEFTGRRWIVPVGARIKIYRDWIALHPPERKER